MSKDIRIRGVKIVIGSTQVLGKLGNELSMAASSSKQGRGSSEPPEV